MRTLIGLMVAVLVLVPVASVGAWPPDKDDVQSYIAGRQGTVSWAAIGRNGHRFAYHGRRGVPSASVIKVMFMVAYLRQRSVKHRALKHSDKKLLSPMIKRSDNDAATEIANELGPGPIYHLAEAAGMKHFHYTRPWGNSTVNAAEQAMFMYHLDKYVPERHEDYARYLLSHVVPSQRWGIGELKHPNWKKFFKGGWGSGSGAVEHQVAFIERGDMRIAAAVMITDSPSHSYAKKTLKGVFKRLLKDLPKPRD